MASEYWWHLPGRVVGARVYGDITAADLDKGNQHISRFFAETAAGPIHILFDARDMEQITFTVMQSLNKLEYLKSEKMGWFIVFGATGTLARVSQFLGSVLSQLTRMRFRAFDSWDEVVVFLQSRDVTLSEIPPLKPPSSETQPS